MVATVSWRRKKLETRYSLVFKCLLHQDRNQSQLLNNNRYNNRQPKNQTIVIKELLLTLHQSMSLKMTMTMTTTTVEVDASAKTQRSRSNLMASSSKPKSPKLEKVTKFLLLDKKHQQLDASLKLSSQQINLSFLSKGLLSQKSTLLGSTISGSFQKTSQQELMFQIPQALFTASYSSTPMLQLSMALNV